MSTNGINLSIGKKIGLGFALILVILSLTGGYALLTMKSSADKADSLAVDYVPEFSMSSDVAITLGNAMLATRSYGLTGDAKYLEASRKELSTLDEKMKGLESLAERTTRLKALKAQIGAMRSSYTSYVGYINETEKLTVVQHKVDSDAVSAGAIMEREAGAFLDFQKKMLASEIEEGASKEKLVERAGKLVALNDIIDMINAIRIANWRSQATRDSSVLKQAYPKFEDIRGILTKMAPTVRAVENKAQLKAITDALLVYQQSMDKQMEGKVSLSALAEKRNTAALGLQDSCEILNAAAMKQTDAISTETNTELTRSASLMLVGVLVAIVLGITVAVFITRAITLPLAQAVSFVDKVANRDLTVSMDVKSRDEIGQICEALNQMVKGLRGNFQQIAMNSQSLSASSEELSSVSTQVSSAAEETASQANIVSAAAEQVSKNVNTVATGTEEMSASIREIAKNASEAAKVASHAATVAETTNVTVSKLGDSSIEIGNVIKVITSIAEQTNLLALNATIEAARAGEAGKGFAVVANEVKELAKQTAKATEEISSKIKGIQGDTQGAVDAIKEISTIIDQINKIQTVIASSVEEQSATTNEISKNVSEAAQGANEIAKNIGSVSTAAKGTTEGANQTATAAHELARLSSDLKQVVDQFKIDENGHAASMARTVSRKK